MDKIDILSLDSVWNKTCIGKNRANYIPNYSGHDCVIRKKFKIFEKKAQPPPPHSFIRRRNNNNIDQNKIWNSIFFSSFFLYKIKTDRDEDDDDEEVEEENT